jgi:Tfp pilus assembly protein PilF
VQRDASLEALCRDADALLADGDEQGAAVKFREALARDPTNVRALLGMGGIERTRGRFPAATALFRRARRVSPGEPEPARALVGLFIEIGHLERARHELEVWLNTDPDSADAREMLGGLEAAERSDDGGAARRPPPREDHRPPRGRRPPGGRRPRGGDPPRGDSGVESP